MSKRLQEPTGMKAITELESKRIRNNTINLIEARPLSEKVKTSHIYTSRDKRTRITRERV